MNKKDLKYLISQVEDSGDKRAELILKELIKSYQAYRDWWEDKSKEDNQFRLFEEK